MVFQFAYNNKYLNPAFPEIMPSGVKYFLRFQTGEFIMYN